MMASVTSAERVGVQARVQSIDILRGAIMIVMALDHVRDFWHFAAQVFSPTDLSRTTTILFFTRWITHFCAPVFMFTAGLGAFLFARGRTTRELSRFLWTRGLWLIVLELAVVQFALSFRQAYNPVILNVLWALGWSMIALALLVRLPFSAIVALSVAMIALHDLADGVKAEQFGRLAPLWKLLHQQGVFQLGGATIVAAYPLIPWIGVMAAGYCCGPLFLLEPERCQRLLVRLGLGLTVAFIAVRAINVYGDPAPWSAQSSAVFTVLSFLNCSKYPPSFEFLLMTLGPALVFMGLVERVRLSAANPLLVFGRTPLFYFVIHLYLAHAGASAYRLIHQPGGVDLAGVYAVWIALLIVMYPLCRWYAGVKQRRKNWWLSYV
jgi:uncharacterized membrane protein